jgi:PadR family transcriptional regulator PadR
MDAEGLRGHIDTIVLAALQAGAAHGYALVRRLEEQSDGLLELGEGTIYASLHRLERDRLVSSSWTQHAGRRRRVYELTPAGAEALQKRAADWHRFARGMRAILGGGPA